MRVLVPPPPSSRTSQRLMTREPLTLRPPFGCEVQSWAYRTPNIYIYLLREHRRYLCPTAELNKFVCMSSKNDKIATLSRFKIKFESCHETDVERGGCNPVAASVYGKLVSVLSAPPPPKSPFPSQTYTCMHLAPSKGGYRYIPSFSITTSP